MPPKKNMGARPAKSVVARLPSAAPAAHLPQNAEQLQSVLQHLMTADTETVKQAEIIIKEFLKHPQSLQSMIQQLVESQSLEARQMAAVLLRKHISKLWKTADPATRDSIKALLLRQLVNEPSRAVMRSIAQLISKLAVESKKWPALLSFLVECAQSSNADHREIALLLFSALTENIPNELKSHVVDLQQIFLRALNDADDRVRIASLRAIEQLVDLIDPEDERGVMSLAAIIEPLVQLVQSFLTGQAHGRDEDVVKSVLHVFDTLSESPVPVLDAHLPNLSLMMVGIIQHRDFDRTIHEQATAFLVAMIRAKPNKVVKMGLVDRLFTLSVELMTADQSDDFDADEATLLSMGIDLCEALISEIPRQHIAKHALSVTSQLIASGSALHMQAGFIALHHMSLPMCEELDGLLKDIVPLILSSVRHPHVGVRRTAWIAAGELAENIQSFGLFATAVLPVVFEVLSSTNEISSVREKACLALESVCEHVDKTTLAPYADEMMNRLFPLMQSTDLSVASTSVNTVKLLASMKLDNFARFASVYVPALAVMLKSEEDDRLDLRCRATECLGSFAAAVGKEAFAPYLEPITAEVLRGYTLDHFGVRESGYLYFAELATCLKDDIQPLLSNIFTLVLASIGSDDGMEIYNRGNGLDDDDQQDDYNSDIEEDEGDEGDEEAVMRRMTFSLRSGALDEKIAAISCLAMMFDTLDGLLQPYVIRTLAGLAELEEYPHPLVREGVFRVYDELLRWRSRQTPTLPKPQNGQFVPAPPQDHEMLAQIMHNILVTLEFDDEREVVELACDVLVHILQVYGIAAVHPEYNKALHKACLSFLRLKAPCQRPQDESEDDHHDPLTETITDVLPAWAKAGGMEFYGPFFGEHLASLLKLTAPSKPADARGAAIGCLGDMTRALSEAMVHHATRVVPVVLHGLQDKSVAVRRNAAYAVGELCAVMPQVMESHFQPIVEALEKLYHIPADLASLNSDSLVQFTEDDYLGCRDNGASAIGKIIGAALTLGKSSDPRLSNWIVLMLQGLPLANDQQEAKHVYPLILSLYQHYPALIQSHTPNVLSVFAQMFGHPEVDLDVQRSVIAFCQACASGENAQSVQQCVAQWPEQHQTQWRKFVIENQAIVLPNKQQ